MSSLMDLTASYNSRLDISHFSLDQLKKLDGSFCMNYTSKQRELFILEFVSILYSDDHTNECKLQWIRLSTYIFRSDLKALTEFCSENDQFRFVLDLYRGNHRIVIKFLELVFSQINTENLAWFFGSGGIELINVVVDETLYRIDKKHHRGKHQTKHQIEQSKVNVEIDDALAFMMNLLIEAFHSYPETKCKFLATGLMTKRVPLKLCRVLQIAIHTTGSDFQKDVIGLLDSMYWFSNEVLREHVLNLPYFESLFSVFATAGSCEIGNEGGEYSSHLKLDLPLKIKILTQLTKDSRCRNLTLEKMFNLKN
ncbi:unnamed protein product [Ambrosiozyma monospora]|uniref:Unnamed protein product n=1 Tax=Ambrosiozyma monospora TaxID=43982 RepID=A0ACB5TMR5_AMBMO|nr:unnamed protein product [Ambrosiozyma monospora]